MKRITIPISGNIDSVKAQLKEELGIDMSYHQVVEYLIKFYRKNTKPVTTWSMQKMREELQATRQK